MEVHDNLRRAYSEIFDVKKYMDNIEYWSNNVEAQRVNAFSN